MRRGVKGYLTIYVSLCMSVMVSLCLVLIEGVRQNTIRTESQMVVDIGMESLLAEFHQELFRQYNLFYIDSSYGSQVPSYNNVKEHLEYYLYRNVNYEDTLALEFLYEDFLAINLLDVEIDEVHLATDYYGYGLARQTIAAVADDVGISYLQEIYDLICEVEESGFLENDVESEKENIDRQLQEYDGKQVQISEKEWTTVEVVSPTKIVDDMETKGILWWTVPDEGSVSGQQIDLTQYVSYRQRSGILNQGNGEEKESLNVWERLLFQEYLLRYTGRYGMEKETALLSYQTEYLIQGKDSDEENLAGVVSGICGIRQMANMGYLLTDAEKMELVKATAAILSTGFLIPEAAPVFEGAIFLAWAYMESVYDTKVLLSGGKIPFLKTGDSWHYDLDCIWSEPEEETTVGQEEGQEYTDYLRIFLFLQNQEELIGRFMDLIEMDIRLTQGNENFRLDGCLDYVGMNGKVHSSYGYQFEISRERGY